MSRKYNLIKEIDGLLRLNQVRKGSFSTRLRYKQHIRQFAEDLVKIRDIPPALKFLKLQHIESLITYWKEKGLKAKTICNKLGAIRTIFSICIPELDIPSNKILGIQYKELTRGIESLQTSFSHVSHCVKHPFTRSVLAFQLYFGLTKTESVRINLHNSQSSDFLLINRALAYNSKSRIIPISGEKKINTLQERQQLLGKKKQLVNIIPESSIKELYKADFLIEGFDPNFQYRQCYALTRYHELSKEFSSTHALNQLQEELGITSRYHLKTLL